MYLSGGDVESVRDERPLRIGRVRDLKSGDEGEAGRGKLSLCLKTGKA